jgi:hypothetical protein
MSVTDLRYSFHCFICLTVLPLWAGPVAGHEAVWHCSKYHTISLAPDPIKNLTSFDDNDLFYLSSFQSEVISISHEDIADVFTDRHVAIGHLPLTGCFVEQGTALNRAAFESIGLNWSGLLPMLILRSIQSHNLSMVHNEDEMRACIVNNFPAVGYMTHIVEDEEIAPCH